MPTKSTKQRPEFFVYWYDRERHDELPPPPKNCIVLQQSEDWNDFGEKTDIEFYVFLENGRCLFEGHTKIGFFETEIDTHSITVGLSAKLDQSPYVEMPYDFFTSLFDMQAYRDIVEALSPERAKDVLLAINDLATTLEFKGSQAQSWFKKASDTRIFQMAFMRRSETLFALYNAGSIVRGLDQERLLASPSGFKISYQLNGWLGSHDIEFKFSEIANLPKNISVLIGENGVGKSQALREIVLDATRASRTLLSTDEGPAIFSRVMAFAPTNEAATVFPRRSRTARRTWYRTFLLNRGGNAKPGERVSEAILQLARSPESIAGKDRWEIFRSAIGILNNSGEICFHSKDPGEYILLDQIGGQTSELRRLESYAAIDLRRDPMRLLDGRAYSLSSGEMSFLRFAAFASLYAENGSILLFDEPETHLHPAFISQFVRVLSTILELTGSFAVIATHSAYFVREVFADQVKIIRRSEDRFAEILQPSINTFGADVGIISQFVFEDSDHAALAEKVEESILASEDNWATIEEKYSSEVSPEILMRIRSRLGNDSNETSS